MDKLPFNEWMNFIDSLSTFIQHKKPLKFCFVGLKCQRCHNLGAFLGVKSGLMILVRVKDLTFCNSGSFVGGATSPLPCLASQPNKIIWFLSSSQCGHNTSLTFNILLNSTIFGILTTRKKVILTTPAPLWWCLCKM